MDTHYILFPDQIIRRSVRWSESDETTKIKRFGVGTKRLVTLVTLGFIQIFSELALNEVKLVSISATPNRTKASIGLLSLAPYHSVRSVSLTNHSFVAPHASMISSIQPRPVQWRKSRPQFLVSPFTQIARTCNVSSRYFADPTFCCCCYCHRTIGNWIPLATAIAIERFPHSDI